MVLTQIEDFDVILISYCISMNSFDNLIFQLNKFIKKYHAIQAVKGGLLFFCYAIVLLGFVGFLEFLFFFPTNIRLGLLCGCLLILFGVFASLFVSPFFRYLGIFRRLDHISAAKIIGKELNEIGDKLLNTLQLSNQEKESSKLLLLSASIQQRAKDLSVFSLSETISFKRNKNFIFAFIFLFGLFSLIGFVRPEFLIKPINRVINYNDSFEIERAYSFVVNNNNKLSVLENDDLNIIIETVGEPPKEIYLFKNNQRLFPIRISNTKFTYKFKNVQNDFSFRISDGFNYSKDFNVVFLPKASLSGFTAVLAFPKYTGLIDDTVSDFSGLEVPFGTSIYFNFKTKNTSSFQVVFSDSTFAFSGDNKNSFSFKYTPKESQEFLVTNENSFSEHSDSSMYDFLLIDDAFPGISVNEFFDSSFQLQRFFDGSIKDDYGISKLTFNYQLGGNKKSINVPLTSFRPTSFYFDFDFTELNFEAGDDFTYYFEVWDNDAIKGPKSSRSSEKKLTVPSFKEKNEVDKQIREKTVSSFANLEKEAEALQLELKNIKADLLSKKDMTWNDKSRLEAFFKKQEALSQNLKKLQSEMAKKAQLSEKSKEILDKQKQLEEMMDNLMSEEMKKLYEEMNRLMEEMNKDELLEKMEDVEMSQDNLLKELDRSLEHFKRLEVENKAEKIAEQLEELSREQRELQEKTKDKNQSLFDLTKKQEDLQNKFFEIQNELSELNEMNEELESPKELNKEDQENQINDAMNQSESELENNKRKKAAESQEKAAEKMDELASSLNKMSNSSNQKEEDAESLRQLLENLISFSLEQEELLKTLKTLSTQDPRYIGVGQSQRKLKDDVKIIEDSLDALGKRQIMISNMLNKEVQEIKRSLNYSIKNITERKKNIAGSNQHNVMMHTNELALLLSEMLKQMQNSMPGTGQCNKPGGKGKNPGKSLSQNAEQIKKQIEQMKKMLSDKKGGQKGGGKSSFEQLGRLAAEQAAIKKQLMELAQELNKDGSGKGNGLNKMIEKIEETEEEIINNDFDLSSIMRQEEIKIKLLELEKALKEQDQQKERESKEGIKTNENNLNNKFEEYQRLKQREVDLLKTIPPNLKPYYKNKVNEYFNSLEN